MRSGIRALFIMLVGVALAPFARADTPVSLSGQWSATPLTVSWSIGDWGEACGPRPTGGGERAGTATIEQLGGELAISGAGHPFTTSSCWEPLPGLTRTSHSAGSRSWRTTCKSPATDPRQSSLVTTVTATSNDQISFDETGQYQFVIRGQNCTASVRRTRFFKRLSTAAPSTPAAGATTLTPPSAIGSTKATTTTDGKPVPKSTPPACAIPGPAARIEVRPSHKLIRPGESTEFVASVVDARGCRLGAAPTFKLDEDVPSVTIGPGGKVSVGDATPEGQMKLTVSVGSRSVKVSLDVVSRERYDALLAQGGYDPTGASTDAAVARLESGSVGARSTVVQDESAGRRTLFVGVVGAAALGLGLVGLVLVRRSRKRSLAAAPPPSFVAASPPATATPGMVCPTCRDEYPPEAQFCAKDGNRLIPLQRGTAVGPTGSVCPICGQGYDPGVTVCPKHDEPLVPPVVFAGSRTLALVEARKICPVCGAQYTGESQFCGSCGAALVPVN